ncbi:hypothetical protein HDV02_005085, partial [Globomyces sp. JEL0801]
IDKKKLKDMNVQSNVSIPSTDAEVLLASIWSNLLDVELNQIGQQTSFFELGGDSISSMQLVSRCRAVGWTVNSKSIFKLSTLKRIANSMVPLKSNQEEVNPIVIGRVPLTPIQKQFFVGQFNNINHFNQSNVLIPSVKLNHSQVQQSINKLALHHDMLRAVYQLQNNQWIQTVQDPSSFQFPTVVSRRVESHQEMEEFVQASQMQLNIESGPLYFCSLIEFGDEQRLFLTIHHLVIDLVSWRIIFEDLELLLKGLELPLKTLSFLQWSELLEQEISSTDKWNIHTSPVDNFVQNSSALTDDEKPKSLTYFLSKEASSKLDKANAGFKTNIQDLILSAKETTPPMRIFMKVHGREPWKDDIDVIRSIRWFTSMYPVVLPICN